MIYSPSYEMKSKSNFYSYRPQLLNKTRGRYVWAFIDTENLNAENKC